MSTNTKLNLNLSLRNSEHDRKDELVYKPMILNLNIGEDFIRFKTIYENAIIVDVLYGQLKELFKTKNPKIKYSEEEYTELIQAYIKNAPMEKFGVWVYYPWSNKLIHILDEDEFVALRTIRNCYKITPQELLVLRKKVIGIVGLSAGHAIALTMASERICGELRLVDHDVLELTNLNRIKTGIQNLGIKKTVIAAREIAEIDPFIKVKCYHEGINDNNISSFLMQDGKVDLCLEECDDFYVKFALRYRCRDLKVPVVMATSDNGLIDIERFDLEPQRKIFHGLSTTTNIESLRNLSTDQKIPYLYEILSENDMSVRLKASLIEIDETINGWPQLSSAVASGGGMATDISRRILLGYLKKSGRFTTDVEAMIKDDEDMDDNSSKPDALQDNFFEAPINEQKNISNFKGIIKDIVSDAILAPSGGNAQAWKWISNGDALIATLDIERISQYADVNNWGSILALGCGVENAIISACRHKLSTELKIDTANENGFAAELKFKGNTATDNSDCTNDLADYIKLRQTNRKLSPYKPFDQGHKRELIMAVHSIPGAQIQIIENREQIAKVAEIIAKGDKIRFLNKQLHHEMMNEIRWDKDQAARQPYGIEIDSLEISAKDKIGLKIFNSWAVASFVKKIGGEALGDISRKHVLDSSALALITMPALNKSSFFNGGRAVQRFWLTASKYDVAVHPLAALCYFFMRIKTGAVACFDRGEIEQLQALRKEWEKVFNTPADAAEIFLCRLFYSDRSIEKSRRISVDQILQFK